MSGISGATLEKVTSEDVSQHVDSRESGQLCADGHSHVSGHSHAVGHSHGNGHSHASDGVCPGRRTPRLSNEQSVDEPGSAEHSRRHAIVSMDTLGIFASTLCLIHCLAMPLVVAFLPVLGLQFLEGHAAHLTLAGFVVCFGLLAILPGYMKHRRPAVLAGLLAGLSLVLSATFGYLMGMSEAFELPLITIGNLVLVASHYFNRQLCKCEHH